MVSTKVDADHASDSVIRRSRTRCLVWLNSSLVHFWSKKQTSVETSSFGSEFFVMKQCCEYLHGLRYKLRMMGIPMNGPCFIQGDNKPVTRESNLFETCCITSTDVDVLLSLFVAFTPVFSGVLCALCVQCLSHL